MHFPEQHLLCWRFQVSIVCMTWSIAFEKSLPLQNSRWGHAKRLCLMWSYDIYMHPFQFLNHVASILFLFQHFLRSCVQCSRFVFLLTHNEWRMSLNEINCGTHQSQSVHCRSFHIRQLVRGEENLNRRYLLVAGKIMNLFHLSSAFLRRFVRNLVRYWPRIGSFHLVYY